MGCLRNCNYTLVSCQRPKSLSNLARSAWSTTCSGGSLAACMRRLQKPPFHRVFKFLEGFWHVDEKYLLERGSVINVRHDKGVAKTEEEPVFRGFGGATKVG